MIDPFATDTADPARIFREMFPVEPAPVGWRFGSDIQDFVKRGLIRKKDSHGQNGSTAANALPSRASVCADQEALP